MGIIKEKHINKYILPVEVLDSICDLEESYLNECVEISKSCKREGYKPFGKEYESRCKKSRGFYEGLIDELLEGYNSSSDCESFDIGEDSVFDW